jgi:phospholipid/cholesterol/gamma-HCH transport system ATP-binding protein
MEEHCVIDVRGLTTVVGGVTIHRNLDLCVRRGEILAVIGGSGSGKTMLLRLMLGLQLPTQGEVRVFGCPLAECAPKQLHQMRKRWAMLFQDGALFSALTVFDNVALPLRERKLLPEDMICDLVMVKLGIVGIEAEHAGKMPAELSGGMVKRVALARALVLEPELLFLDEPTAGLDPDRSKGFVKLLETLRRKLELTVVMVTHDLDTLVALADRVAVLADEKLIAVAPLWEVVNLEHPFIHSFFLGHRAMCAQENVKYFREQLTETALAE